MKCIPPTLSKFWIIILFIVGLAALIIGSWIISIGTKILLSDKFQNPHLCKVNSTTLIPDYCGSILGDCWALQMESETWVDSQPAYFILKRTLYDEEEA